MRQGCLKTLISYSRRNIMRINNNLMAMNTHRQLGINANNGSKSIEKLSSGYRINRAGDDAAGLAISEKMRAQIRGLSKASRNAQDSISLVQTAEGALNETQAILQRMRELAVQSANDTNVYADRSALQNEVDQLATEITRISNNTEFNERKLLDGGLQTGNIDELTFHIGANSSQNVQLGIGAMDASSLGIAGNGVTGVVASGAVDVSAPVVDGTAGGTSLVDGESLTITAVETVLDQGAATTLAGVTYQVSSGSEFNGYSIVLGTVADATAESAVIDTSGQTITINGDFTNSGFSTNAALQSGIDAALAAGGFTSTITVGGAAAAGATNASGAINAGTDAGVTLTIQDSATNSGSVSVSGGATSASFTGANFSGLSITLDGSVTSGTAATIDLTGASAATFSGGALTGEATIVDGVDISTQATADTAITTINTAITLVSDERAKLGAVQNRLEHTIKNLDTSAENLQASESRIRDVDMAKEMMEFTKNNILQQAAQAMLAQANQAPQGVLQLLR
jgi:flagellin